MWLYVPLWSGPGTPHFYLARFVQCSRMSLRNAPEKSVQERGKSPLRKGFRLVSTRRTAQPVILGDPARPDECIEVVVEGRRDRVRLGPQAPRSVAVDRLEIWENKQGRNKQDRNKQGMRKLVLS